MRCRRLTVISRLRDAYREAKQNPADEITFKWLRMNMWVSSTTSWIPDAIFMKGNEPIDMRLLEGRDCYVGLDLSSTGDITALVLIFPPRNTDEKYILVPFGQGFASMSTPTKEFYRLLMESQIVHAGHPVLRCMAGNVVIETDAAENIKVTKAKSKEKIDGIVASIMALDRCLRNQGEPQGSVYDERGLLIL